MDAAVAALRREQILVTRITPAKAKAEEKAEAKADGGKTTKRVAAKNLAVFTRQFSVMIDAGLPLVQCLEILGNQEEDKNFARGHPADARRRRRRRVAGRRDAEASRRRSTRCSPTWLRRARRAASSTRF